MISFETSYSSLTEAKDCPQELNFLTNSHFLKPGAQELKGKEIEVSRRECAKASTKSFCI